MRFFRDDNEIEYTVEVIIDTIRGGITKSNSIYKRLKVHYGGRTNPSTNGINMKMPQRRFIEGKLVLHVFLLEKKYEKDMIQIIDPIEKKLHERLKPVTGRK